MEILGFTAPWGLLALLGIPLVLWLHKLRRRLVERRVAGLFLFAPDTLAESAGRTVSPLLRTASLWLELLGALLLALLLAQPRWGGGSPPPHLVVVLDDTASMGARVSGTSGPTVADEARRFAESRIDALASDGVVTLVLSGRPPTLLAGPRASRAAARAALESYLPVATSHDRSLAIDLGVQLAGLSGDEPDEVVFVTDEADPEVPARVEVAAFGKARDGAAIASARRFSTSPDHETLTVDVVAYASQPYATEVVVRAGLADGGAESRVVARKALTVDPARPARLALDVPSSDLPLRVDLSPDALDLDGAVVLLPERTRVVPYRVEMAPATAAALRLDRVALAVPGMRAADEATAALVFSDREAAPRAGTTRVVVGPMKRSDSPGAASADDGGPDDWLGPFLVDRANALVEGLTLEGVVWSAGRGPLRGRGLVYVGEQALLSEEAEGGQTTLRLNLDPRRSTLAASADWPILLSNVVERARSSLPGQAAMNARVGESLVYRLAAGEGASTRSPTGPNAAWRLALPSGREEPARSERLGDLLVFEAREPGIHRLLSPSGEVARWAVAFVDGKESDLRGRGASRRPPKAPLGAPTGGPRGSPSVVASALPTRLLALLLLAIVAADMWVLDRTSASRRRRPAAGVPP